MEAKGRLHVGGEFVALVGFGIGIEDEAVLVETLQQHHAHIGHSVRIGRWPAPWRWVVRLARLRLLQPFGEERERRRGLQ